MYNVYTTYMCDKMQREEKYKLQAQRRAAIDRRMHCIIPNES